MIRKLLFILFVKTVFGQVGIGTDQPDDSSILDIESNDRGLLIPRMTTSEKKGIQNPQTSLIVYDTDLSCMSMNKGTSKKPNWVCLNKSVIDAKIEYIVENAPNKIVNDYPLIIAPTDSPAEFSIDFGQNISLEELDKNKITIVNNARDKMLYTIEKSNKKDDNSFIFKITGLNENKEYNVNIQPDFLKSNIFQFNGFSFSLVTKAVIVEITDDEFRKYLKNELKLSNAFPEDGVGMLIDHPSLENVTRIIVTNKNIKSLNGIQYFTNLRLLKCDNNDIKNLDLSKNTNLEDLDCSGNHISNLYLNANTKLKDLDCSANDVSKLDLSANIKLESLNCSGNDISKLDLSANTTLESLDCSGNDISKLDLSANTTLESLDCSGNDMSELDLSASIDLESLNCSDNKLNMLDLSKNINLQELDCSINLLTSLDIRGAKTLNSINFTKITGSSPTDGNWNLLNNLYVHENIKDNKALKDLLKKGHQYNRTGRVTISTYDDAGKEVCSDYDPEEEKEDQRCKTK